MRQLGSRFPMRRIRSYSRRGPVCDIVNLGPRGAICEPGGQRKRASAIRHAVIQAAGGTSGVAPTGAATENLDGEGGRVHLGPQIPTILSGQRGTHFIERRSAHDDGEGVVVANPHSLEVIYIPKNPPPPHTPRPKAAKRIPYSTIESLVPIESSCSGRTRTFAISETPHYRAQTGRSWCARTCGRRSARYTQSRPDTAYPVYARSCLGKSRARMRPCGEWRATLGATTTPTGIAVLR